MSIKRTYVIFETGKKLFLDKSSTNTDTLVPSLYQCVETRNIEFWRLSHFRASVATSSSSAKSSPPSCEPLYMTNTSYLKQETFHYEHPLHWIPLITKIAQQNADFRKYSPQARSPFWLLKPTSEHARARLLTRLSWSWTMLLPSNTHRKPITSITAALLPFVIYLLTPLRI
jgi:hypothetical protein